MLEEIQKLRVALYDLNESVLELQVMLMEANSKDARQIEAEFPKVLRELMRVNKIITGGK